MSVAAGILWQDAHGRKLFHSRLRRARACGLEDRNALLIAAKYNAQLFLQPAMRAEKPQPYRYTGYTQPLSNFLCGVLQNIAQQADLPEIRRKLGDRTGQERSHLAPSVAFFGILLAGRDLFGEVVLGVAAVFLQRNESGTAPLAKQVDRCIRRDPRDPGVQVVLPFVRIAGELIQPRKSLQQSLLLCVLRVGGIPRQTQRAAVKSRSIRKDELGERGSVAPARFTEQARTTGGAKVCLGPANSRCFET